VKADKQASGQAGKQTATEYTRAEIRYGQRNNWKRQYLSQCFGRIEQVINWTGLEVILSADQVRFPLDELVMGGGGEACGYDCQSASKKSLSLECGLGEFPNYFGILVASPDRCISCSPLGLLLHPTPASQEHTYFSSALSPGALLERGSSSFYSSTKFSEPIPVGGFAVQSERAARSCG
jgi:hypothetical protein